MSLNTYQGILDSIPVWLHRQNDQEVTAIAPDLVQLAEQDIYTRLRTRYNEARFQATISGGTVSVPSDYTDFDFLYIDIIPVHNLTRKSPDYILSEFPYRTSEGVPEFIARDFDVFIFGPFPDSEYNVRGIYYKSLPSISVSVNPLLIRYPGLFLFGALLHAEGFIRNDPNIQAQIPIWQQRFNDALAEAQGENDRERMSGGRARMHVVGEMP